MKNKTINEGALSKNARCTDFVMGLGNMINEAKQCNAACTRRATSPGQNCFVDLQRKQTRIIKGLAFAIEASWMIRKAFDSLSLFPKPIP